MKDFCFQNKTGPTCIQSSGKIGRAVTQLMSLLIISFSCMGLPSIGHGTADPLTPEERAWLTRHDGKLIVNNEAGWPPIIDRDSDGNSFGIVMDYQRLIEKKLGFKFKLDKPDSWDNFMERFRKGEIDVNNNLQKNPNRIEYALFTKPYIEIPNAIIVRNETKGALSLEKMRDMKIAVTRDFAIHDYIKNNFEYLQIMPLDNDLTCLLETATKGVDAAVVNLAVASYLIEKEGIVNLRAAGYAEYKNALCFASRKDLPILNIILEKGLGLITPEEREGIYRKWIALGYEPFYKSRIFWIVTCSATAAIIVFAVLIIGWNRSLRRQVQLRTEKLEDTNIQLKGEINERKEAERALRESEELHDTILSNVGAYIFLKDSQYRYTYVNNKVCNLFGVKESEIIGKDDTRFFSAESVEEIMKSDRRVIEFGETVSREETGLTPSDGVPRTFLTVKLPLKDSSRNISGLCGISTDITERKEVEVALRESQERFQELAELLPETIFEMDISGNLTFVNRTAYDHFGYSQEDFERGLNGFELISPEERSRALENTKRVMSGEKIGLNDYKALRKDGSTISVSIHSAAIFHDGKPVGIRGIIIDVTDTKKLESQLRQAQKMEAVGTLAGGIAHDFNNLLMGIQGRASLLSLDLETSDPHLEHIKAIEEYIRSATNLTKQLLGFASGGKYEVKPIDMNDLVLSSSAMFGRTKKEIKIHAKCQESSLVVEADRGQIEQVLLNIYVNAWQAMPPDGGELYLETKIVKLEEATSEPQQIEPGRYVKVSITDTGAGMDEATRLRIFDPFFTTKEKSHGTGLGLASAYGIIKNHGGMITVYSEVGHGTTFNIYLPISEKEAHREVSIEGGLSKGSATILLVDDEELIIDVGQAMLEKLGYRVIVSRGGQEAVKVITKMGNEIDLVILDMIMPGMDGGATFDRVREIQPEMPVILSSGYAINGNADKIMRRGCNGFIQKPYNISELSQKIRKVLDESRSSTFD